MGDHNNDDNDGKPLFSPSAAPDLSILGNHLGLHPSSVAPSSSTSSLHSHPSPHLPKDTSASSEHPLLTSYASFRSAPFDFLKELSLHVSGTGWRSYDHFIGQDIFYKGFSERIKGLVLQSPRLLKRIEELARKRVHVELDDGILGGGAAGKDAHMRRSEIESQLRDVADEWTENMICKMESRRFIRGAYYFATQLLTRAYHQGIHVSSEEVLRLRAVAEEAERKKQSIIFLPCHRSHVDYVSLQLICYRLGLALPTVVAGDNLNFPVVGPFLQHAGAMWIRRSFGDDALYTTLVQSYIDTLLQEGYNFECFVEGGRSRTGKLLQPKFGILSFLLESILSNEVDDAIICPVSTQYDKVIEVDSYISELLGQPKPKESLANFLSNSSVLSLKLGRVDVRFHEPWSLRQFVTQQITRLPRSAGLQSSYDASLKRRILSTLGYKVLADINAVSVVMPTALIGTVLLTLRGRGVGFSELVRRVEWLTTRVQAKGGRVAHFAGLPTKAVVDKGLDVLGTALVGEVEGLPERTFYAADRFQLSFYRNMTIHLFVEEALVSAALYTKVKLGGGVEHQTITYKELEAYVYFLSQLFRAEFIFPTTPLASNIRRTLQGLESDNVISIKYDNTSTNSTKPTPSDNCDIESIALSTSERLSGRENFDFYCFLIWPFIESSWLSAVSLLMLTPPSSAPVTEPSTSRPGTYTNQPNPPPMLQAAKDKQDEIPALPLSTVLAAAQTLGKTLYAQGDLSYLEAVNKETLRNSYNQFASSKIIDILPATKDGKIPARVRLRSDWLPPRGDAAAIGISASLAGSTSVYGGDGGVMEGLSSSRLWEFCESISRGRREGKNRRDGGTVVRRVLDHVELVGSRLWFDAASRSGDLAGGIGGRAGKTGKVRAGGGARDIQAQSRARQGMLAKL